MTPQHWSDLVVAPLTTEHWRHWGGPHSSDDAAHCSGHHSGGQLCSYISTRYRVTGWPTSIWNIFLHTQSRRSAIDNVNYVKMWQNIFRNSNSCLSMEPRQAGAPPCGCHCLECPPPTGDTPHQRRYSSCYPPHLRPHHHWRNRKRGQKYSREKLGDASDQSYCGWINTLKPSN